MRFFSMIYIDIMGLHLLQIIGLDSSLHKLIIKITKIYRKIMICLFYFLRIYLIYQYIQFQSKIFLYIRLTLENKSIEGGFTIQIQTRDFRNVKLFIQNSDKAIYNTLSEILNKKNEEKFYNFSIKYNKSLQNNDLYNIDEEFKRQGVDLISKVN
jgi:hypothetical protein